MSMQKALHLRDDRDKLFESRIKKERGLASIEDWVDQSTHGLEDKGELEIRERMVTIQITAMLRSARMLRIILETFGELL